MGATQPVAPLAPKRVLTTEWGHRLLHSISANCRQYSVLKDMCSSDCIRSNEDLDVVDIMIPRPKGSAEHVGVLAALLVYTCLP